MGPCLRRGEEFKRCWFFLIFQGRPNISEIKGMLDTIDQYNQMQTDTTKRIKTSVELEKKRMVGSGLGEYIS